MRGVAWTQVSPRNTEADKISNLPRHSSPATRNPAKTKDRSYRDFCYRRLPSRTVRTRGSAKPSRESSVQIRLALPARGCETDWVILPVRELCFCPVQCARTIQLREARPSARRSLPAPVLLDELSWQRDPVPWSGNLGRADSPCSGRTDSSTTQIRTAGNCVGKRTQSGRKAAPRPTLCFSCVRFSAASACE